MINTILWSKDRACQLDLTLTTYKKYFKEWADQSVSIIYTHSNEAYGRGYEIVKKLHPEFNWVRETNFRLDTINIFNDKKRDYTAFLVDDDVFVDYFSLNSVEFNTFQQDPNIICLSPRMAPYVTYCYPASIPCTPSPFLSQYAGKKVWEWKNGTPNSDWSYPWSVACHHIFRSVDLQHAINNIPFRAPNSFEGNCLLGHIGDRPYMISYDTAKCICSTNNKIQMENMNRNENSHPVEFLNANFLAGKRLCPDINHQRILNACHGPLDYKWRN